MNRRSFLNVLATAGAVAAMDPERLLWVPGKKLISIPKPPILIPTWIQIAGPLQQFNLSGSYGVVPGTPGEFLTADQRMYLMVYHHGRPIDFHDVGTPVIWEDAGTMIVKPADGADESRWAGVLVSGIL